MQVFPARRGISGIQVLVAIGILLVLGGILVYASGFFQAKFRTDERKQMMKQVALALEQYKENNKHYPLAGDPIPGGAIVSANNSFSTMFAALGQGKFYDVKRFVDPAFGAVFKDFNGINEYEEGVKFVGLIKSCQGENVIAMTDSTESVFYSYFTTDGKDYVMCLLNENGEIMTFVSPKDIDTLF